MTVKIRDARYAGTVYEKLPSLPQVAFVGRSNVGKSSLINTLLNRRSLVKTSKQPGKTRNINFFEVDLVYHGPIYMVDLPGYGYARVPQGMKSAWDELAARYFRGNRDLKLLLVLIDIRRSPGPEEEMLLDLARKDSIETAVIATKADKLSLSARMKRLREIREALSVEPITASSHTRLGIEEIWKRIIDETSARQD
ncbi:MAG TPA: ribosome biogenesis GTP-binding protein YihA/YsxC [Deltaproteobacteria bacterium]|nr:ribosome biogenesis GTP-binding protein YihA/YsxC [Deltaproteobacteria bacterium]